MFSKCLSRSLPSAAAALFGSAALMHADTINAFNFESNLSDGYTAEGTVSVDITDGQVVTSMFTLSQNGSVDAIFTQPDYSAPVNGAYLAEFKSGSFTYELLLPNASLVGYAGGSVCTTTATCLGGYPSGVYLPSGADAVALNGSLTPAATPEPTSLILLATGLGGGYLLSRRRRVQ